MNENEKATLLIVGNDSQSLTSMREILTPSGYVVRHVESGESVLAEVAANPPDLILLETRMRGLGCTEVCRRLKAMEATRHIPIILISVPADVSASLDGLKSGATDYINTPWHPEELLIRVQMHLSLGLARFIMEQQAASLHGTNDQLRSEIVTRQRVEDELRQSLEQAGRARLAMLSVLEDQKLSADTLRAQNEELARFGRASAGRELRVIDLKQEVNELAAKLGQPPRYPLAFVDATAMEVLGRARELEEQKAEDRGQQTSSPAHFEETC